MENKHHNHNSQLGEYFPTLFQQVNDFYFLSYVKSLDISRF